ncbi:DUF3866 family protein [Syntrophothermus lipocalidus]|uniref:DUF3866 domain-containing protein n=1 Tax=Syntrophothermus lipocalidus (strain DSM 12680 / TGB-C1) TaxID=643648 RepID=D7CKJ7_SYNLT|nr:DUF3866 family protein [Syntrophothermus lipocalidus]ADI01232.1 conserved hypothetical protein [Syntrophothermus lipocalidus DSM 12680]
MIRIKRGTVTEVTGKRRGITELVVMVEGRKEPAVSYDDLIGEVTIGDEVLLNTTAVSLGLGSGGVHFVMASLAGGEKELTGKGHIMKLRYTPLQVKVLAVEEEDSPYRDIMARADSLEGCPVLVGTLHSALAPVCAVLKATADLKVAYIMTDGASLPLVFSRSVAELKGKGLLDGTVTCGHAFGGDLEAVNYYSGLLAARWVLGADVIVVSMGPGIVGTGTKWGYTGIEQGEILNAVATLGGIPVAIPRIGFADPRARHRGVSHHTLTVLSRVCKVECLVPLPVLDQAKMGEILSVIDREKLRERHRFALEDGSVVKEAVSRFGLKVSTMGRDMESDPEFFLACGACARAAVKLLRGEPLNYVR